MRLEVGFKVRDCSYVRPSCLACHSVLNHWRLLEICLAFILLQVVASCDYRSQRAILTAILRCDFLIFVTLAAATGLLLLVWQNLRLSDLGYLPWCFCRELRM